MYLDYNATTPMCEAAREAMQPFLGPHFGNASSVHAMGRVARAAVDSARDRLADFLGVQPHELIFTSGGTESNNLALLGLARGRMSRGRHLISAQTEHHAVLNTIEHLEKEEAFEVTWLEVSAEGLVNLDQLARSIRADTALVSIMQANNETGVVQPLPEISAICRRHGVLLHSDMVQSFAKLALNENTCSAALPQSLSLVDAASFAAHKFYGPKGAGLLFLRRGVPLEPIHFGGAHENQRRPGTENVAGIAGMAAAAEFALTDFAGEQARQRRLRDELWRQIKRKVPSSIRTAEDALILPNTLNVCFPGLASETMLIALDLEGVCASSGSACMVGSVVASHVLLAMGLPLALARSAIRFSLGKWTTAEEVDRTAAAVARVIQRTNARRERQERVPV